MASIGDYNLAILRGTVNPMGTRIEEITRPGVDGIAVRTVGLKSEPFTLEAVSDYDDTAAARAALDAYKLLQGTLVTVVDDFSVSHTLILIEHVEPVYIRKAGLVAGGISSSKGAIMATRWTCRVTAIPGATP